jgi:hypothetical protein
MKAMGMESDQEVVQMVGRDPRYGDLLFPSIQVLLLDDKIDTIPLTVYLDLEFVLSFKYSFAPLVHVILHCTLYLLYFRLFKCFLLSQECASERIYTQQQALQYMDEKVKFQIKKA